jgi:hypothetical protein
MNHTQKIFLRYCAEMSGAFILYALALWVAHDIGFHMQRGIGRTLVLVCPMGPVFLVVWAIARQIQRVDEYGRKLVLETIAIAFGITAACTLTYGFLENDGLPKLSMFAVWPVMGAAWILAALIRCLTGR